jgi:hypothetical protein
MPDGDQPEKQEDGTVPTLAAAPAHDRVIEELDEESYSWLDGLSDEEDEEHPEGSGEEAVDEVLAEDAWQA